MTDEPLAGTRCVKLIAARHIGLIDEGDDLPSIIAGGFSEDGIALRDGDILVIAQKIVSKAEGRYAYLDDVTPSAKAVELAGSCDKDPRLVQLILMSARFCVACVMSSWLRTIAG